MMPTLLQLISTRTPRTFTHKTVLVMGLALLLLLTACGGEDTAVAAIAPTAEATAVPPTAPPTIPPTATQPPPTPTQELAPPPTFTIVPTETPTSEPTITPTATATAVPPQNMVNGLTINQFLLMDEDVQAHVREIYALGQQFGRNPRTFSKVGDSVVLTPHYLARFDSDQYKLGIYANLQTTIDQFAGSFSRFGQVAHVGLSSRTLYELGWADKELCLADENAVDCEIRLNNPSIFLIRLGTNDQVPAAYETNMRKLIEHLLEEGIIPVLGTKADRFDGEANTNNLILHELAAEYRIPLWDFDLVAQSLPDRGLSGDDIHLTMSGANDYTKADVFEKGYPVSDLTALMVLDAIRQTVTAVTPPTTP